MADVLNPVPARSGLTITVTRRNPDHVVAAVIGEIDFDNADQLRERLHALATPGQPHLMVDLSGVGFCDAAGLSVLVGAWKETKRFDGSLCLVGPRPLVAKVLGITGLTELFAVYDTVSLAEAAWSEHALPKQLPVRGDGGAGSAA